MIGGPFGLLAWAISAGTVLIVFIWGLEQAAFAVITAKIVSWAMWGLGMIRQLPGFDCLRKPRKKTNEVKDC